VQGAGQINASLTLEIEHKARGVEQRVGLEQERTEE
jgi:hypothetical protein